MGQKINSLVSVLVQPKFIIPFGSHSQKGLPLVSRKMKKIRGCIKNHVQKNIKISSGFEGIKCI